MYLYLLHHNDYTFTKWCSEVDSVDEALLTLTLALALTVTFVN
jgi:hypothetical protein